MCQTTKSRRKAESHVGAIALKMEREEKHLERKKVGKHDFRMKQYGKSQEVKRPLKRSGRKRDPSLKRSSAS